MRTVGHGTGGRIGGVVSVERRAYLRPPIARRPISTPGGGSPPLTVSRANTASRATLSGVMARSICVLGMHRSGTSLVARLREQLKGRSWSQLEPWFTKSV